MAKSNGRHLWASPKFIQRLKQLQGKISAINGERRSLPQICNDLIDLNEFEVLERRILTLSQKQAGEIKLKWD